MTYIKNKNTFSHFLITFIFIFVTSLFSGTVSSELVMENKNGDLLDSEYTGYVDVCYTTDNSRFYEVHTDGLQKIYDKGVIEKEVTWKNCQKNGEYKYYIDGFIVEEGFYKDDKKSGEWKFYLIDTGNIREISNYKEDYKHGLEVKYREDGTVISESMYLNGSKDGLTKNYDKKTGKLYSTTTYVQGSKNGESVIYTTLNSMTDMYLVNVGLWSSMERKELFDFLNVMTPFQNYYWKVIYLPEERNKVGWEYFDKSCEEVYLKKYESKKDCDESIESIIVTTPDTPIKITMNFQSNILHGPLVISDQNDGHIYTSVEYFRGGKFGDYKIFNKKGEIVFSVHCLKGGKDILYSWGMSESSSISLSDRFTGQCKKDGEQIKYKRSVFSPNQDWYLHTRSVYQDGSLIEYEKFDDPYYQEGMIYNYRNTKNKPVLKLVKDPNLIKGEKQEKQKDDIISKEVDKLKKDLKKLNPFKKG